MVEDTLNSVTTETQQMLRGRLSELPGFSAEKAARAAFERLVGLTNSVYRVDLDDERVCLRIPEHGAAAMVDRRAEAANARAAAKAGVAPVVIHFGADGVMLTRFIDDAVPVTPAHLAERAGALGRAARALRRLHDADIAFEGSFDPFAFIRSYVVILDKKAAAPSGSVLDTIRRVQAIEPALAAQPAARKPCHCDPTGRNLLDTGKRSGWSTGNSRR